MKKGKFDFEYSKHNERHEIVCWQEYEGKKTCYTICFFEKDEDSYNMVTVGSRLVYHHGTQEDLMALIKYAFTVLEAEFELNEE